MWTEEQIHKYLKDNLKEKRYIHTLGVVKAAEVLAKKYNCDVYKAKLAALLHDLAKHMKNEEILEILKSENKEVDLVTKINPNIMHGFCSAYIAKNKMGIENKEVLSAISYHTTGKENMTVLEKVVFLADFIEEGRNYPKVDELRKEAIVDLDNAILMAFDNTITYIIQQKGLLHIDTIKARNYLLINM